MNPEVLSRASCKTCNFRAARHQPPTGPRENSRKLPSQSRGLPRVFAWRKYPRTACPSSRDTLAKQNRGSPVLPQSKEAREQPGSRCTHADTLHDSFSAVVPPATAELRSAALAMSAVFARRASFDPYRPPEVTAEIRCKPFGPQVQACNPGRSLQENPS